MERLWKSDLEDGTFKNPILFADYSDPDVIRVGDTYYMTASSFNYIPGLPVLTSKDLVNWELKNYAIDCIDYPNYDIPQHAKGVWAPAIRYHEGYFYIYYGMPDEGIFMVKAKDPLGKWDAPVLVLEGKGLIDSCPFWDEDGNAYIIHGYAKSRIGFKSHLGIFRMSWDGTRALDEDHILYNGLETQPTIEGPKVYKRNGYYYIFAPAGGVKTGWQAILRSKNIYGPYEEKIVLTQGKTVINGPHQGALVDTVNGDEWFIHFQDRGLYGRIIHMQPVVWENDWPIMGIHAVDGCGEPCLVHTKPNTGASVTPCYLEASDSFASDKLNLMWQWLGNPKEGFYSLSERPGFLRLYSVNPTGKANPVLWECSNVLTQKLVCPYFEAVTCLHIDALKEQEQAGMVMMGGHYAYLAVRLVRGKKRLVRGLSYDSEDGIKEKTEQVLELADDVNRVYITFAMEAAGETPVFKMYYSLQDTSAASRVWVKVDFMPSDHTWVGAKIGLFANTYDANAQGGYADFEYIQVSPLEGKL
ncbi:MAG: glycoside hydrolase 43 family protein [Clostridiales bacterium]|nr:glycoside hydrolase 43 family protein [Roseburia sp.]MDD7635585.1 glycoside hydrolase 43 family protein [Clostridiales bacterium]MDY4111867.1 glycoside hydrolase 43 family protein [Roseburia sp.]